MTAAEMDIAVIPMQVPRATRAALDRNMARTATLVHLLPVLEVDPDHLRIQAPRPDPVRLLDLVRPALPRLPIPLLRVRTLHRTQATAHRPDQATVRRLHLRLRHLPRRHIQVEVVRRGRSCRCNLEQASRPARSISTALFYTALRAERSHPGAETA